MRLGRGKLAGEVVNLQAGDISRVDKVIHRYVHKSLLFNSNTDTSFFSFLTQARQGRRLRLPPCIPFTR